MTAAATRYLVTGAAGFIGSALVRLLVSQGAARVVSVDALTYAADLERLRAVSDEPSHRFVELDVNEQAALHNLLVTERPTAVIHLAAETHVDRSIDGPEKFVHANVLGTFHLLEATRRYWQSLAPDEQEAFRLVNVSTDEVYGSLGPTGVFTETTPYDPRSPYSASKAGADHLVASYFHTFGLPAVTTHASNNYGPFQFPEKLIPLALGRALAGEHVPMYGDGMQVRDWLHVDDHARGLIAAAERGRPGATYLMGGSHELPNRVLLDQLLGCLNEVAPSAGDYRTLVRSVTDRPGHDRRYAVDSTRAEEELDWRRQVAFEDGLGATVRWYVENQTWVNSVADRYDLRRLGIGAPLDGDGEPA